MRRFLSRIVVSLSVIALATPATTASAAGPDEASRVDVARVTVSETLAQRALNGSLREAAERAVAVTAEQRAGQPAPEPGQQRGRGARYQMGGGGKGAMVMGLVMTVVGLGASVYMIKMMQDKVEDTPQP